MPWFFKVWKHRCPDGTERLVYKNVDDAFPLYIPGWNAKLAATADGGAIGSADVKAEYTTKIQGLLFSLDELNQGLMFSFRGAYVAYGADPCGNSALLSRQVERILNDQTRLQRLRIEIHALISLASSRQADHGRIMDAFQRLVDRLGGPVAEAAVAEISDNRELMQRMIRER